MKIAALFLLFSAHAFAAQPFDYSGPNDMSQQCADAVAARLNEDGSDVQQFLEKPYSVTLDWWDEAKSQVNFVIQFDEDVRDGYADGNINVKLKDDGTCEVGKVDGYDIGD